MKVKIGDKLIPVDNSWSHNIRTKRKGTLAGTHDRRSIRPKRVRIVSKPFRKVVTNEITGEKYSLWLRVVEYRKQNYVVLNRFKKY